MLSSTLRALMRRATSSPGVPGVLVVIALLFCLFALPEHRSPCSLRLAARRRKRLLGRTQGPACRWDSR